MKDLVTQMKALWTQLGLNQRVSIGLVTTLVIGGMIGLVFWSHRPNMQLLYGRLSEQDVTQVVAAVQEQGVKFELGTGGTSVYVPSDQVHKLRMHLASKGVPSGEGVGFEIFDRTNFGISDFVQRTNYVRAIQGELSRTISQLHGVRSARVMVVMPENRLLFSQEKAKTTASVFVDGMLGTDSVNSIRFLVANSVEGLRADDVTVVDSRGNTLTETAKDDPSLGSASSQMKYRKSVEDYFAGKVESMLAKVLGPGNVVVRVSAEIDPETATKTEEKFDPDGQVIRTETSNDDSTITNENEAAAGSAVGATANVPKQAADSKNNGGKNSEQSRKTKTQSYEINKTTLNAVKSAGAITRVSATVLLATGEKPRTPAELDSVKRMVMNALGIQVADAKQIERQVSVEEVTFNAVSDAPKTGFIDTALAHSDVLRNLGAGVVALAIFFFFLRMLKKTAPDEIPIEVLNGHASSGNGSMLMSDVSPEMLTQMIRQKPANAGNALRTWMAAPNRSDS